MTIEEVREFCERVATENGFFLDCPIRANARLKRTLGRVRYSGNAIEVIEFSKTLLDYGKEEVILDTINHELAHAFVFLETGISHGHDKVWQEMAISLGANPSATAQRGDLYEVSEDKIHKYTLQCKECGQIIGHRDRSCKLIQYPQLYKSKCCSGEVVVIQNW